MKSIKYLLYLLYLLLFILLAIPANAGWYYSGGGADYTSDANCMGAWFMNNNGGNETDRSGEGETLTQTVGTIPTSATVPSGYAGTSRDFELGDSEYLTHADGGSTDIFGANQAITITAWVLPESVTNGDYNVIVSKYDHGSNDRQYLLALYGTAVGEYKVQGRISNDGTATTAVDSTVTDYAISAWHHVAMVYNDIDIRIYVDGVLACTPGAHTTGISEEPSAFAVGTMFNSTATGQYFDGLIDEVSIYNEALSSGDIAAIYANGISGNKGGSD